MNEKKVTFLINSLSGGGAQSVCINIANAIAEEGWQVDLVVLNLNNAVYINHISDKVKLIVLNVNHARSSFFKLKSYVDKEKPERFLVFNYELAVLLVIIRILFPFYFKVIARNINTLSKKRQLESDFWRKRIVAPLVDFFYSKVDHVINQCRGMDNDLLKIFPNLIDRTCVIYNPVNKVIEDAVKTINYTTVKQENYLLCVGRLEKQKAFHYAIEAFAKIKEQYPGLRLKIVGQGSLEFELKKLAKILGVASKVDFEGFQKNMIPYYLKARAIILTSLYEGFPNVLVESITLGKPIVAFDCQSGPREVIEEGVNGFLVPYKDKEYLLTAIKSTLDNKWKSEDIFKTAVEFRLDMISSKYQNLIERI